VLFPLRGISLIKTNHLRWHLVRALMFMAMTGINFWALQYLQLTVTSSIFFTVPLIIALLGAPLLGERLDAGRWTAIVAGFGGLRDDDGVLELDPHLPEQITRLRFRLR